MQRIGSSLRPFAQLPVDQQSVREKASAEYGQAVRQSGPSAESSLTPRAVVDARKAEAMLFRARSNQTFYPASNSVDSRSQRALTAYTSLEQSAEREYVSSVLGIDEYV